MKEQLLITNQKTYQYGFSSQDETIFSLPVGLSTTTIENISDYKQEPLWMRNNRLQAYKDFCQKPYPTWGPLGNTKINFDDYIYFAVSQTKPVEQWQETSSTIQTAFQKLGVIASESHLDGLAAQYDSNSVYHHLLAEVSEKNVIFLDTDSALREHPELFKKYFGSVVMLADNKFAALNSAVWSGGTFIYVPPNTKLTKPLHTYFRMNKKLMGQFERTLIIVDENSELDYVEGCTAPTYSEHSLHAAVVEIIVCKNAKVRYTTLQNWSKNVYNLVTKRARVAEHGQMHWIDANIGSAINMKYPSSILQGDFSKSKMTSIAVANGINVIHDAGAKMIHLGRNTSSEINAKSIALNGGQADYRGLVQIAKSAVNSFAHVDCASLILDPSSSSNTMPYNICDNATSTIQHEANIVRLTHEQLAYLMSRALSQTTAKQMITVGFVNDFLQILPMEYAVEVNQLLQTELEN